MKGPEPLKEEESSGMSGRKASRHLTRKTKSRKHIERNVENKFSNNNIILTRNFRNIGADERIKR